MQGAAEDREESVEASGSRASEPDAHLRFRLSSARQSRVEEGRSRPPANCWSSAANSLRRAAGYSIRTSHLSLALNPPPCHHPTFLTCLDRALILLSVTSRLQSAPADRCNRAKAAANMSS